MKSENIGNEGTNIKKGPVRIKWNRVLFSFFANVNKAQVCLIKRPIDRKGITF